MAWVGSFTEEKSCHWDLPAQWFSTFFCLWPTSQLHSRLWPPLILFNYNKCNIFGVNINKNYFGSHST
jgi:hypothetical protein